MADSSRQLLSTQGSSGLEVRLDFKVKYPLAHKYSKVKFPSKVKVQLALGLQVKFQFRAKLKVKFQFKVKLQVKFQFKVKFRVKAKWQVKSEELLLTRRLVHHPGQLCLWEQEVQSQLPVRSSLASTEGS